MMESIGSFFVRVRQTLKVEGALENFVCGIIIIVCAIFQYGSQRGMDCNAVGMDCIGVGTKSQLFPPNHEGTNGFCKCLHNFWGGQVLFR